MAAPGPQREKLDADAEKARGDREFSDRHDIGAQEADSAVTITPEDIVHTGKYPTLGWPEYPSIFPYGAPDRHLAGPHLPYGQSSLVGLQPRMGPLGTLSAPNGRTEGGRIPIR